MATARRAVLPPTSLPWIDTKTGLPTDVFRQWALAISTNNIGPFATATDDTAAAKAGVPVNTLYENAGAVRVRKT